MNTWNTMDSAPRDGTWFLVLRAVTIVGGGRPTRADPELLTVSRVETSETSRGYWQSIKLHSIADHYLDRNCRWAPLNALPLRELWADIEAQRVAQGGRPGTLPTPLETAE